MMIELRRRKDIYVLPSLGLYILGSLSNKLDTDSNNSNKLVDSSDLYST